MFRLQWDWDPTEGRRRHCDSVCFGAEPEPQNTPGSIRRDEGEKLCHRAQNYSVAWSVKAPRTETEINNHDADDRPDNKYLRWFCFIT